MPTVLPDSIYAAGAYPLAQAAVPQGASSVTLAADRTFWLDPLVVVNASMEISFDNGQTWSPGGAWSASGGAGLDRQGNPVLVSSATFGLPQPANPNRKVRGQVIITGGPLRTTVSVTLT